MQSAAGALGTSVSRAIIRSMAEPQIAFSRPYRTRNELPNIEQVLKSGHAQADGQFTVSASQKLKAITGVEHSLLTPSGTHALEMASLLLSLEPGDEVILPSFTFPSAANAVAMFGAVPVFIDVELSSGNIDAALIERAITSRTRAISVMHYGGVAVDLDLVGSVCTAYGLPLIEDNAHGLGGLWRGTPLGSIGLFGTQSFHATKNVHSGEGGALLVNDPSLVERAEIIREKGTDRSRFLRNSVDKYTWTDLGSSYAMSELNAAILDSQLTEFSEIQERRQAIWDTYAASFGEWAAESGATLMSPPVDHVHTAHLFYILMPSHEDQLTLIAHLQGKGIIATFHYIPLDSSSAGRRYGKTPFECPVSEDFSRRVVRLPLWAGMTDDAVSRVVDGVASYRVVEHV